MKLLLLLASLQKTCEVQNIGYGTQVIKMINIFHWHTCVWEQVHLRVQICCLGKVQNFPILIAQALSELKTHIRSHACMTIFGLLFLINPFCTQISNFSWTVINYFLNFVRTKATLVATFLDTALIFVTHSSLTT